MKSHTIYQKVGRMSNAIHGAVSNPEIVAMLEQYGYNSEKLNEGVELLNRVNEMMNLQVKEYGDKYTSTGEFSKQFDECYKRYIIIIKIVRIAFKNENGILHSLHATGVRKRTYSGWLNDARVLYGNLLQNEDWLLKLQAFAITRERLENEYSLVMDFEKQYLQKLKETGEAQQSTRDRDAAIDELSDWHSDFRAVARIALYERPQLLEALGIVVKS